jgi:type I restriction-modification system DNA methylase subunit
MAFDQGTRGELQKFVTDIRKLLTDDFTRQLQQTYGMDPVSGEVAPLDSLKHLDDERLETAQILREVMDHYLATEAKNDTRTQISVLERIAREQAFTILNRLAALRMMEARGILLDSIGHGTQSQAFRLFQQVANSSLGDTGETYKHFLHSLFDLFTADLPSLFDRYGPQSRLFPTEATLTKALELINSSEVEPLWAEDETIGWIYQYFNSKEERKEMRKSRAPRNSRELAVRNQFFTPRYVVEFLVDNTLGRLWFNWTGGQNGLRDRCQYLLVKPDEQPEPAKRLRDPRTIKLLDPACGSMHFGLYAFDLFLEIYREAWVWEQTHGPGCLDTETGGNAELKPLSQTYADQDAFQHDVPRLIIEHNIYGVDIDPRAAQIASLALWLRAQRAWHEAGVKAKDRPQVGRGHVVAAVAPPAEMDLRKRFMKELDPRDATLFEQSLFLLKGLPELGILLRVEKDIRSLIRKTFRDHGELFRAEDNDQWQSAEVRLQLGLNEFASAARSNYQGRLFAQDALAGLRMIEICQESFDVLVMNPPFGEAAQSTNKYLDSNYPNSKGNILTQFMERSSELVRPGGRVGAIVSRTCFYLQSFRNFRSKVLAEKFSLDCFVDLGSNVLDAMVEVASATWTVSQEDQNFPRSTFFRILSIEDKASTLLQSINKVRNGINSPTTFERAISGFQIFDDQPYIYWIEAALLKKISEMETLDPNAAEIRVGLQTGDDFRFLRTWWETPSNSIIEPAPGTSYTETPSICIDLSNTAHWAWYSKTEVASPLISSIHLLVKWRNNGAEIKAYHEGNGHSASKYVMSESKYFLPGFSYMLRSVRLVPYLVPAAVIPTAGRSQVYSSGKNEYWIAALLASNLATAVARFRGESFFGPKFQNSMVGAVPYKDPLSGILEKCQREISARVHTGASRFSRDETEIRFLNPPISEEKNVILGFSRTTLLGEKLERELSAHFGLSSQELSVLESDLLDALKGTKINEDEDEEEENLNAADAAQSFQDTESKFSVSSWAVGVAFGRFDWRLVTGERAHPSEPEPFDPLPSKSPGMLSDGAAPLHVHRGILVEDPGHPHDLARLIEEVLARIQVDLPADVRRWLQRDFFKFHLKQYSKSRRKAPIYWPISTGSGSYTLWLYYPSITSQSLYTAVNDFLEGPSGKLKQVEKDITALRNKGSARSSADEKSFENLQSFEAELIELRDNLLEIAPNYHPNHDDGVQISAAPLWRLFRHKPWQKVLKDTWAKLENGDYDWAHLAMAYWPERVCEKCRKDKSLAISHDLEDLYEEPEVAPGAKRGRTKTGGTT